MIIGKVIGYVISTRKIDGLMGSRFTIIEPYPPSNYGQIVAGDSIGAVIGDDVLVTLGSTARMCSGSEHSPLDAMIVAIVDNFEK